MHRWTLLIVWLIVPSWVHATGEGGTPVAAPGPEVEEPATPADEGEGKGIIPRSVEVHASTQPVTPASAFPEKPPYDQARDELAQAEALWAKGAVEAASDTALEAYDDLNAVHRRNKKERKKLFAERHRAATIYVQAGIRFIREFVNKNGGTPQTMEEGRSRLEDLRDVARNYEELNRDLNKAVEQLTVK